MLVVHALCSRPQKSQQLRLNKLKIVIYKIMETCDEPLNLTVKKMPIAIVAPFTRVEPKVNNEQKIEDVPQDLSMKLTKMSDQCLDLRTKDTNLEKANLNNNEQLRNYLCKNQEYNHDKNMYSEQDKLIDLYKNFAFINNLADNKLLSSWYLNPYLNLARGKNTDPNPDSNRILNNLLDKKPFSTYKFPTNFDALIVNEMRTVEKNEKKDLQKGFALKAF